MARRLGGLAEATVIDATWPVTGRRLRRVRACCVPGDRAPPGPCDCGQQDDGPAVSVRRGTKSRQRGGQKSRRTPSVHLKAAFRPALSGLPRHPVTDCLLQTVGFFYTRTILVARSGLIIKTIQSIRGMARFLLDIRSGN